MMVYKSMDYWSTYSLPIPIRKWLILRWNKYQKDQEKQAGSDTSQPLSDRDRKKMIATAQKGSNNLSGFMNPRRNK